MQSFKTLSSAIVNLTADDAWPAVETLLFDPDVATLAW